MNTVAELLMLAGGLVSLLAAAGVLRFSSSYARFHAAGKASPISFIVAATGASISLGTSGAIQLATAALAMTLTLPVGVHMLYRAVHRTSSNDQLRIDDLTSDREASQ